MNTSFYTLPLEELMEKHKLWFWCQRNGEKEEWSALSASKLSVVGKGDTPREAVIALAKKLNM